MARVFLDANVLFSAAYKKTKLRSLWKLPNVTLLSSSYAVAEAETNLARERPEAVTELEKLLKTVRVVKATDSQSLPASIKLEDKDRPILMAAISASATHLLTGDIKHFGHLLGMRVEGVLILTPAQYFQLVD